MFEKQKKKNVIENLTCHQSPNSQTNSDSLPKKAVTRRDHPFNVQKYNFTGFAIILLTPTGKTHLVIFTVIFSFVLNINFLGK